VQLKSVLLLFIAEQTLVGISAVMRSVFCCRLVIRMMHHVHNVSHNPARGGPRQGHRQQAQKIGEVWPCGFQITRADRQSQLLHYYYIRLTVFFQDNLGKPAPEKQNHSGKTNLDLLDRQSQYYNKTGCDGMGMCCKKTLIG